MSEVKVNNGNIEDALKRFKRQCARNGVLQEVRKREVVGIGISGQMHGLVMLDENNEILRNSIIWCDQCTENQVK